MKKEVDCQCTRCQLLKTARRAATLGRRTADYFEQLEFWGVCRVAVALGAAGGYYSQPRKFHRSKAGQRVHHVVRALVESAADAIDEAELRTEGKTIVDAALKEQLH